MPQLRRFEGSTPEQARVKAIEAFGPDVVIVRAGRERSGGLLGFFEHEVFVLEVDADASSEPVGVTSALLSGAPQGRLEALADGVHDAFELSALPPASHLPARRDPEPYQGEPDAPGALLAASAQGGGSDRVRPSISREFSQLLQEAEATVAAARTEPLPPPPPVHPEFPYELSSSPSLKATDNASTPVPAPVAVGTPTIRAVAILRDLGLPEELIPPPDEPLDVGLLTRLRRLPEAPRLPKSCDAVVMVVGSSQHLWPLARAVARRLGVGSEAIVAVSTRSRSLPAPMVAVRTAREAAAEIADRRIARSPSVVALEARMSGPLPRLVGDVATALRPDACWAAVPASCSPEHLHALVAAAGRLDAISVVELDDAERPAALLSAGLPVAAIELRRATAVMWAARLVDRVLTEGLR